MLAALIMADMSNHGQTLKLAENVIFQKTNEVMTIRSKWLFTAVIDLDPFAHFLAHLANSMNHTNQLIDKVMQAPAFQRYNHLFEGQKRELEHMQRTHDVIALGFEELKLLNPRRTCTKRAILPAGGKLLSFLFGTLTKQDLKSLKQGLQILENRQDELIHVVEESISMLNITQLEVKRNRHYVQKLAKGMKKIESTIVQFHRTTGQHLQRLNDFLSAHLQLNLMLTEFGDTLSVAMYYLEDIKLQLNQLALGHLAPSVLEPDDLENILLHIQEQLPDFLMLPKDVNSLWYYYQILTCTMLVKENQYAIVVTLPLLDRNSNYEIYKIHNVPLPHENVDLVAYYELETTNLAVNIEHTNYVLMNDVDMVQCNMPLTHFCALKAPSYTVAHSHLCVVALFLRDSAKIRENCQTIVLADPILPQATYLSDGTWIIVSRVPITFTAVCAKKERYQERTIPPLYSLQLGRSCYAFFDSITLPPYFQQTSRYEIDPTRNALLTLPNVSAYDIWKPLDTIPNATMLIENLQIPEVEKAKEIPLSALVDRLHALQVVKPAPEVTPVYSVLRVTLSAGSVLLSVILSVSACLVFRRKIRQLSAMISPKPSAPTEEELQPRQVEHLYSPPKEQTEAVSQTGDRSRPLVLRLTEDI